MRLVDKEFSGTVIEGGDPDNRGRYRVTINGLMPNIYNDSTQNFIYCTNEITGFRDTFCDSSSNSYGQYFPLQVGTKVIIKFHREDYESAYVSRINSDYYPGQMPLGVGGGESDSSNRDNLYQLMRTPGNDVIAITGKTTAGSAPKDSIYFYHKEDNVKVTYDTDGIHVYTKKNLDEQIDGTGYIKIDKDVDIILGQNLQVITKQNTTIEIDQDNNITIKGNSKIGIEGDCDLTVKGNNRIGIYGNCDVSVKGEGKISVSGNCNLTVGGNCMISASGNCDINATKVNLNCGPPVALASVATQSLAAAKDIANSATAASAAASSASSASSSLDSASSAVSGATTLDSSTLSNISSSLDKANSATKDLASKTNDMANKTVSAKDNLTSAADNATKSVETATNAPENDVLNFAKDKLSSAQESLMKQKGDMIKKASEATDIYNNTVSATKKKLVSRGMEYASDIFKE